MVEFVITRTSLWDEKPCREAYEKSVTRREERKATTLIGARKCEWFDDWYEKGINHRVEHGYVVCDAKVKTPVWVVNIDTMEELLEFEAKYGQLIVRSSRRYKELITELEIYDGWRE